MFDKMPSTKTPAIIPTVEDVKNACKHQVREFEKSWGDLQYEKHEAEIARLNNRIEGMAKDNLNLLNSKLMLRKQNRIYRKEIERLKKELSLVI